MHTMTEKEHKAGRIDLKALVGKDREFLRELIRATLQEVLEAEMTDALGAAKGERKTSPVGDCRTCRDNDAQMWRRIRCRIWCSQDFRSRSSSSTFTLP